MLVGFGYLYEFTMLYFFSFFFQKEKGSGGPLDQQINLVSPNPNY